MQPKVALITGAARRVGACIAKTLHQQGYNVALHYHHSAAEAQQLAADLNATRDQSAVTIAADLRDIAALPALVAQAQQAWPQGLCALINNASVFYRTAVADALVTAWQDVMTVNAAAPYFLAQAALPYLQQNKGVIINITDTHAEQPLSGYGIYCISKAALRTMTHVLAKECAPAVRVNAVAPGAIAWPEGDNALTAAQQAKILEKVALQRHGDPQDIANAVLFLLENGRYITGQTIHVDGYRT